MLLYNQGYPNETKHDQTYIDFTNYMKSLITYCDICYQYQAIFYEV